MVCEAGRTAQRGRAGFRRSAVVVISCVLAGSVLVACSGGGGVSPSSSPVASTGGALPEVPPLGRRSAGCSTATSHLPIGAAELRAHFAPSFLAQIGPAKINQAFRAFVGAGWRWPRSW